MVLYILKSAACMAILLLFYRLLLEKENMHVFKRYYLLGALVVSLLIPSIVFTEYVEASPILYSSTEYVSPIAGTIVPMAKTPKDIDVINMPLVLLSIYLLGLSVFGFRFFRNLFQIITRIRKNPKYKNRFTTHVLLLEKIVPHTFFQFIFLNKSKVEANAIPKEVLLHEETHAKQKHSLDVLFVEILQVIFWFNPLVFLYKQQIKLNHEFLADSAVLKENVPTIKYQNTLLSYISSASEEKYQSIKMANAINYSSIQKRFKIMKTQTSKKAVLLRSILVLPLLAILLFGFSQKQTVEQVVENRHSIQGVWLEMNTENYGFSITKDNNQLVLLLSDNILPIEKIRDKYYVNRQGVKYPITINKDNKALNLFNQNFISEQNSLRKKFEGNWINISGTIKLKVENFTDSFVWSITENGNTNKFYPKKTGESFQFSYGNELWSFEAKNNMLVNSNGASYSRIANGDSKLVNLDREYSNPSLTPKEINQYNTLATKYKNNKIGQTRILVSEIKNMQELYSRMDETQKVNSQKLHGFPKASNSENKISLSENQIKKYNGLASKYNKQPIESRKISLKDLQILEYLFSQMNSKQRKTANPFPECLPKNIQQSASRKLMAEYNTLAKKYNEMDSNRMRIRKSDVERLAYIYGLMSDKQKADAEPFPDFPEPPPVPNAPNPPNEREEASEKIKQIIKEQDPYDVVGANINVSKVRPNAPPATRVLNGEALNEKAAQLRATSEALSEESENLELQGKALKTQANKLKVMTPASPKVLKGAVNNPPQPPTPVSPLDLVIEMAKNGATFYYEGKEISSDKAITLLKNNENLNIKTTRSNSKKPQVQISKNPIKIGGISKKSKLLDYALELEKKNADFYYDNQPINSQKGIALIKSKKYASVETLPWVEKNPEVKIYSE